MTTISAVIPVYNGARYVAEAISSVLAQTRPAFECLVIDDGSTDATAEVVGGFGEKVTYVHLERGGVSNARNHGIQRARGELVAFLDHDDVWLPVKLERQLDALQTQPKTAMVLCATHVFDVRGAELSVKRFTEAPPEVVIDQMITFRAEIPPVNSNALVRRHWLLAAGGYDPLLSTCADWDILLRTLLDGGVAYIDEPLTRYRVHDSNMSRNIASIEHDMVYAFAKTFADPRLPVAVRAKRRHAYGRMYRMLAGSYRDVGQRRAMLRTAAVGIGHDPTLAFEALKRPWRRPSST